MRLTLPLLLSSLFILSACSQQTAPTEGVQACLDKLPNSKLIKKQAVTTGCLLTAGFWKAIGQDNPASLVCMAGGGSGFLLGKSVAERKCSYRIIGDQIDGEIAHAQKVNLGFSMLLIEKAQNLATQEATVASLLAQHKAGQANLVYTKTVKQDIAEAAKSERQLVNTLMKEAAFKRKTLNESRRLNKKDKTDSLQKEVILLTKNIKTLRKANIKLYRLENQLAGL